MSNKNYKGGYKIVSLQGIDLITMALGVTIMGIHKIIESSYQKPLLLSGIVIDGVEKNDVYITEIVVSSGSYVIKAYGYEITITSEDEVTATEIPSGSNDVYIHTITSKSVQVGPDDYIVLTIKCLSSKSTSLTNTELRDLIKKSPTTIVSKYTGSGSVSPTDLYFLDASNNSLASAIEGFSNQIQLSAVEVDEDDVTKF